MKLEDLMKYSDSSPSRQVNEIKKIAAQARQVSEQYANPAQKIMMREMMEVNNRLGESAADIARKSFLAIGSTDLLQKTIEEAAMNTHSFLEQYQSPQRFVEYDIQPLKPKILPRIPSVTERFVSDLKNRTDAKKDEAENSNKTLKTTALAQTEQSFLFNK